MQKYLLDTHALIWWANAEGISQALIKELDRAGHKGRLFLSTISFWEIGLLLKKKKILIEDFPRWRKEIMENTTAKFLNPTVEQMVASTELPDIHNDPFDRLLIAQAKAEGATLVTKDRAIAKYEIATYWG